MTAPLTRRRFGAVAAAAAAPFIARPRRAFAAAPPHEVLDTRVISHQARYYHGWSTVARLANGELVLAWSGRREAHVCPFGTLEMMRSRDGGESWTYPRTVHESDIDDRDAGVLETAQGSLLITTFTSLAYAERGLLEKNSDNPAWAAAHNRRPSDEARQAELGTWLFRSTDGGATFSERIDSVVNSPHGPCQLEDGRLLYAGKELWTEERRIGAVESTDDGLTWNWIAEIPAREGDNYRDYHELHAVQCASGKIVAQIRNHNTANQRETLQTESEDGGRSWSVPREIGVWGLPSHLLRLRDDRLVMSYGHRRDPFGNQARISEDEGATWSDPVVLSGDGAGGDLGYPSTVELDDGTLLTVWYEKFADSPNAQLRQARWTLG